MDKIIAYQDKVLEILKGKADGFYLAGGTALSKFYFHHRESYDLDFFTQDYSSKRIDAIVAHLTATTGKKAALKNERDKSGFAKLRIYTLPIDRKDSLKIDFVEDFTPLIHPAQEVNGIHILSKDDIYMRKIGAVSGTMPSENETGQRQFLGGRQVARDFYDLFILSSAYKNLSAFAKEQCDDLQKEALIRWFASYDRMEIKLGLLELVTPNGIEFQVIERHFRKEIDKIFGQEV